MKTHPFLRPGIFLVLLFLALARLASAAPSSPLLVLRSGNGAVDGTDSEITFEPAQNWTEPFPLLTSTNFAAAENGASAWVVLPNLGPWMNQLPGDDASKWVAPLPWEYNIGNSPTSLFAMKFNMPTVPPVVELILHSAIDDYLGDNVNGQIYLNGSSVPGIPMNG
ncbi:MAG TPA: hypothetical protein VHY22_11000, partial [Chthoniobacteraceae bacterium]|nr:hypothetical protein [Chthoniobacteraceae bacterium]